MRGEPITFSEMMEMLGVDSWDCDEEKVYELDEKFVDLDHFELLELAVQNFANDED
jgi:hypothetical protein